MDGRFRQETTPFVRTEPDLQRVNSSRPREQLEQRLLDALVAGDLGDRVDAHAEIGERLGGDRADRQHLGRGQPGAHVGLAEALAEREQEVLGRATAREHDRVEALASLGPLAPRSQRVEQQLGHAWARGRVADDQIE